MGLLVLANVINIGADLGAMGAALQLILPGPKWLYVPAFAMLIVLLEVFMRYARYVSVLRWLTLSLFAYVATVFVVGVPWGTVAYQSRCSACRMVGSYFTMVVAIFGTTISPYLFFWQASEEVEDVKEDPAAEPILEAPAQGAPRAQAHKARHDGRHGRLQPRRPFHRADDGGDPECARRDEHRDLGRRRQGSQAHRRRIWPSWSSRSASSARGCSRCRFLAGSAAYALGETLGWRIGLAERARRAPAFYLAIAGATLVGALLNFSPLDPIKALIFSAVVNGVAAVPIMVMIMHMASRREVMGDFALKPWLKTLGWLATAVMTAAAVGMFATWNG